MQTIGELVVRSGRRFSERVALEGPEGTSTFAVLAERVTRLASGLLAQGLRPGDRVLDLEGNTTRAIEIDLALASAGLCRVPLNPRSTVRDWERIADDCAPRGFVFDPAISDAATSLGDAIPVVACTEHGAGPPSIQQLIDLDDRAALPEVSPDEVIGLNYSSGTTGEPKAAKRTTRMRLVSAARMVRWVLGQPPNPTDTWIHAGSVMHTSGLFVLPFVIHGARQRVLPTFDPESLLAAVEEGGTHTVLVPTMVTRLLTRPDHELAPARALRLLAYAGAPMAPSVIDEAWHRLTPNLAQYYGLVEAMCPLSVLSPAEHRAGIEERPELLTSAGTRCPDAEVEIRDEDGAVCARNEIGEIATRGDHVTPGYLHAGGAERGKSFVDGWLLTGDLGRLDDEDHLFLVDRRFDMIITGGYNVYPSEVENVLHQVPGINMAAVVGLPDAEWGQAVTGFYTVDPGRDVTEEAIREHCARRLPAYKRPKLLRRVDEMPVNAVGKVLRRELTARGTDGVDRGR